MELGDELDVTMTLTCVRKRTDESLRGVKKVKLTMALPKADGSPQGESTYFNCRHGQLRCFDGDDV